MPFNSNNTGGKRREQKQQQKKGQETIKIDFSLRREVLFVVSGAILGAIAMMISKTITDIEMGLPYYFTWMVFGHVIGVHSDYGGDYTATILSGMAIHLVTAISIGTVTGIFLYKTGILNISKPSNGLLYGLFTGTVVFFIFYIPVQHFVLAPETIETLAELRPSMPVDQIAEQIKNNQLSILAGSAIIHIIFGITLGITSSLLSIKLGTRYRCPECDISFPRIDIYQKHRETIHGLKPNDQKRILILGGGFGGIEVLKRLQKEFQNDIGVDMTIVNKDNYFLFTPMLHEISTGAIETRHITTPIRAFCKRAKFYEATVDAIDLKDKTVNIAYRIGKNNRLRNTNASEKLPLMQSHSPESSTDQSSSQNSYTSNINYNMNKQHLTLKYDYLVIALGGETKYFGINSMKRYAFSMKTLGDAIILRNHVISMLEEAEIIKMNDQNKDENDGYLKRELMTFVVVGGGFGGVETVGALNDFVRDSVKTYYHNIDNDKDIRVILVSATRHLLPEMTQELGDFALKKLEEKGVKVVLDAHATEASENTVKLDNGEVIRTQTIVWSAGVSPDPLISRLPCEHDKSGRIKDNHYLQLIGYPNVFAIGDCAHIIDPDTGKPYPPTAQHALREAKVVAENIISILKKVKDNSNEHNDGSLVIREKGKDTAYRNLKSFHYKTKGNMATVGNRNGVAIILGFKIHGFWAWWLWRTFYLLNLPTLEKKMRVMIDWTLDMFFKQDVTRLKAFLDTT